MHKKILVTGSSGRLGRASIEFLLEKISANRIAALARDAGKVNDLTERGVEVRTGDYHDFDSLTRAFKDIDTLFLISTVPFDERFPQHKNAIDAARQSGIKQVVYTSMQRKLKNPLRVPWATESDLETEAYLKESGLDYTILRNTLYSEAIGFYLGNDVLENGIQFPGGIGRISSVPLRDLAEASANLLIQDGHRDQEYTFSASESYSFADIAESLSAISGRTISYTDISNEEFAERLAKSGLPTHVVEFSTAWAEAIKQGEFSETTNSLEKILGRKPVNYLDYFKTVYFPKAKAQF